MRQVTAVFVLISALALGACGKQASEPASTAGTPAASATTLTPEQLGELGAQIEKNPATASELLSQRGLNETTFEEQIRKVSSDPEASRRYRDSYQKARA
ncbi:MAG: hypothetical protein WA208_20380 [Thermoanaerobaculia bacterium]